MTSATDRSRKLNSVNFISTNLLTRLTYCILLWSATTVTSVGQCLTVQLKKSWITNGTNCTSSCSNIYLQQPWWWLELTFLANGFLRFYSSCRGIEFLRVRRACHDDCHILHLPTLSAWNVAMNSNRLITAYEHQTPLWSSYILSTIYFLKNGVDPL